MTYREVVNIVEDEILPQDIVLSRGPMLSPWITLALAVILLALIVYLLYSNLLMPAEPILERERSLRVLPETRTWSVRPNSGGEPRLSHRDTRSAPMLQSRTLNALLGGAGPASTFDYDAPPRAVSP